MCFISVQFFNQSYFWRIAFIVRSTIFSISLIPMCVYPHLHTRRNIQTHNNTLLKCPLRCHYRHSCRSRWRCFFYRIHFRLVTTFDIFRTTTNQTKKIYKTTITITELEKSQNNSDTLRFKYANERRARKKTQKIPKNRKEKSKINKFLIYAFNFFLSFNFHSFPFSHTSSPNEI